MSAPDGSLLAELETLKAQIATLKDDPAVGQIQAQLAIVAGRVESELGDAANKPGREKIEVMSAEVIDSNPYSRLLALQRMGIVEEYQKIREKTVAVVGMGGACCSPNPITHSSRASTGRWRQEDCSSPPPRLVSGKEGVLPAGVESMATEMLNPKTYTLTVHPATPHLTPAQAWGAWLRRC